MNTLEKWRVGLGGGSFKFFDDKGLEYALTISEDSNHGIMLSYEQWDDKKINQYVHGTQLEISLSFQP